MNREVDELLNKLGNMEDAPLIWINKKVGNLIEEVEQLQQENQQLKEKIDKAIEYIEHEETRMGL